MLTVIFVHGISIRSDAYEVMFGRIENALKRRNVPANLVRCLWGDAYGASLRASGASIPSYRETKGVEEVFSPAEQVGGWRLLAEDPLIELRLLTLHPAGDAPQFDPAGRPTPDESLDRRIRVFSPSDRLLRNLERVGISTAAVEAAARAVAESRVYDDALKASLGDLGEFQLVWARAVTALAVAQSLESSALAETLDDPTLDDLSRDLASEVGNQPKGLLSDWLGRGMSVIGTRVMRARRGHYTDAVVPFIGDVVVYQGNGQPIRNAIAQAVQEAGPEARVVLLGHSLGGIACVDLLADAPLPTVKLLVTVGSQAPLFYEIDALQKLRFGEPLPGHFPLWLNLFDHQDFLSYVGKAVFKDPQDRVTDVRVDNRQPFPGAHSAYWANPRTWDAIVPRLIAVDR